MYVLGAAQESDKYFPFAFNLRTVIEGEYFADKLIANGESGKFDFAFIDADKENYVNYYNKCIELLRSGGVIMIDNVSAEDNWTLLILQLFIRNINREL